MGRWIALAVVMACAPFPEIFRRNAWQLMKEPALVERRISQPVRSDARLAVLWIGHATVLVQLDDKLVLTDPVFIHTVGQLSPRLVEPGLAAADLPPVDAVLVSHLHFDHLSFESLDQIEDRVRELFLPADGLTYLPRYDFASRELTSWESAEIDGLRITAVPVDHVGFRYGADAAWMDRSFTGWVVQYHGLTVYFGGDTAYDRALFRETASRIGPIDLALMPIGPVNPREFAQATHVDGVEAVRAFLDLEAEVMVPIHYGTFIHGLDEPGDALASLQEGMARYGVGGDRVRVLRIGEQCVLR